jgi:hypothetical protein
MDTMKAYANGIEARAAGAPGMVFDWEKAARLNAEREPRVARAGLRDDWEYTGGEIWRDGAPVTDAYTFLGSIWAVPELELDGEIVECFRLEADAPGWDSGTKWPAEALAIVGKAS